MRFILVAKIDYCSVYQTWYWNGPFGAFRLLAKPHARAHWLFISVFVYLIMHEKTPIDAGLFV